MNPRVQVEHTVSEMVTGIDIVKSQIHIAEGHPLASPEIGIGSQADVSVRGYAIQCRITTEDPANNFIPDYGRIAHYRSAAGFGIRLDAGTAFSGAIITPVLRLAAGQGLRLGRCTSRRPAARCTGPWPSGASAACAPTCPSCATWSTTRCSGRATPPPPSSPTRPELLVWQERFDRATEDPAVHRRRQRERQPRGARAASARATCASRWSRPTTPTCTPPAGTRDLWKQLGTDDFCAWVRDQKRLLLTDTTFRDAHQSLMATRLRTHDMTRVAPAVAQHLSGLFSLEMWGGATFDVAMRFLHEDPWERLALLRQQIPNILFQMLLRGANAVGYTNYPDNVVRRFVEEAARDRDGHLPHLRLAELAARHPARGRDGARGRGHRRGLHLLHRQHRRPQAQPSTT